MVPCSDRPLLSRTRREPSREIAMSRQRPASSLDVGSRDREDVARLVPVERQLLALHDGRFGRPAFGGRLEGAAGRVGRIGSGWPGWPAKQQVVPRSSENDGATTDGTEGRGGRPAMPAGSRGEVSAKRIARASRRPSGRLRLDLMGRGAKGWVGAPGTAVPPHAERDLEDALVRRDHPGLPAVDREGRVQNVFEHRQRGARPAREGPGSEDSRDFAWLSGLDGEGVIARTSGQPSRAPAYLHDRRSKGAPRNPGSRREGGDASAAPVLVPAVARTPLPDPPTGPAIIACNHVSYLDLLTNGEAVVRAGRRPRFLAKEDLFRIPVIGRRSGARARSPSPGGREPVFPRFAAGALVRGEVVVVYPEGTVTQREDGLPMDGKTGVVRLALQTGLPITPMASSGLEPSGRKPGRGRSTFGRPMDHRRRAHRIADRTGRRTGAAPGTHHAGHGGDHPARRRSPRPLSAAVDEVGCRP